MKGNVTMTDGNKPGGNSFNPSTDERLISGSMLPPKGHPGDVSGAPYGKDSYSLTYYGAGTGLGHRIKGFRGLYDMELDDLGRQIDEPEKLIAAWEKGQGQDSLTILRFCKLCDVFRTTPNSLLMGPYFVQAGPLDGMGQYLETLPDEAQLAILHIARMCRWNAGKQPPPSPYL